MPRQGLGGDVSGMPITSVQRAGHHQQGALVATSRRACPLISACRWWRRIDPVSRPRRRQGARGAGLCIAEVMLAAIRRRPGCSRRAVFQVSAEMVALFADLPEALENSVEIARRCNLRSRSAKTPATAVPDPDGVTIDSTSPQ